MKDQPRSRVCSLCGQNQSRLFYSLQTDEFTIRYVLCRNCGFVFQSNPLSQEAQDEYYARQYRKTDILDGTPTERVLSTERARAKLVSEFLSRHGVEKVKNHLDIGCSTGCLLQEIQSRFHGNAVGVEPGEIYRNYTKKSQLEVYPSMEAMSKKVNRKFDLITMMHVLEHLENPLEFLETLRTKWFTPTGTLVIEVPNTYTHDSFEFAHLSAFTPHTFREMLRKAGFRVEVLEKHGRPRSKVLPLYMTVIALPDATMPSESSIHPEHYISTKRKIGMFWRKVIQRTLPSLAWQTPNLEK